MRCLADESVDRPVVLALRDAGYEVDYVAERWPGAMDADVLRHALASDCIGELVIRRRMQTRGVVLFRFSGLDQAEKAERAVQAFQRHEGRFVGSFTVVERQRARMRPLGLGSQ